MLSLAVYNMKGGVGKTTAAVNLAYSCALEGNRVLLWDLDSQGAATFYLNIEPDEQIKAKKLLKAHKDVGALIQQTAYPGLDIIPASFQIRHLDSLLEDEKKGEKKMSRLLESFSQRYDHVLIDCPPSISFLSEVLFRVVDCLVIPVIPTVLSRKAFEQVAAYVAEHAGRRVTILPFFSMFDWRKKIHREAFDQGTGPGGVFLKTCIPTRSAVEQMGVHRAPLAVFSTDSGSIEAFAALWSEIRQSCLALQQGNSVH
jgi:chromosome partitioning protein